MRDIMGERYTNLQEAVVGLQTTGVPFVAYGPTGLAAAGARDDIGIYYLIPEIVRRFGVSLDQAIELFFGGIIALSFGVGLFGSLLVFETWRGRAAAVVGLLAVSAMNYAVGDVYVLPSALAIAVVPWLLYGLSHRASLARTCLIGVATGAAVGVGHYVRSHSATALVIMLLTVVALGRQRRGRQGLAMALALVAGLSVPAAGFTALVAQRDAYLVGRDIVPPQARHPFWHQVYIGFGCLNNRHGIVYEDAIAEVRARARSPNVIVGSAEYENILREEVFRLLREDPRLVGQTLFAKIGVLLFYVTTFGSLGIVLATLRANPGHIDLAFGTAIAFSSLGGILIMPSLSYLTGFIALLILYGMVGADNAARRIATCGH